MNILSLNTCFKPSISIKMFSDNPYIHLIMIIITENLMSESTLEEVLKEVRLIRSKVERLEDLVEERLIGSDEPLKDEAEAMKEYLEAKEKGDVEYIPLEEIK